MRHAFALARALALGGAALLLTARARGEVPGSQEEIIDDPLLSKGHAAPPPRAETAPEPRLWRAELVSRASAQTSWDDLPGGPKDVVELRARAVLSAGQTVSERFRWEIGARFDAYAHAPKGQGTLLGPPAYYFEARPWEAYVDGAISRRLRLKIGNQIISWGRLDVGSAADVLSPYDLREGPAVDVDALRMPTPSALLTWFPVDAFQLDVGYTPFFTPHRFDVAGTNYALLGPNAPAGIAPLLAKLRGQLDPSSFVRLTDDLATINAPPPSPDNGEAAARAVWRAGPYDLAVTYGFVRSKFPALSFNPALAKLLTSTSTADTLGAASAVGQAVNQGVPLVTARYDRYHQLAMDLEGTAGPFTLAGEVGYSPSRTLFARDAVTGLPIAATTGLAQTGLKATYTHDTSLVSAEASVFAATDEAPPGATGQPQTYYILGPHRRLVLGLLAGHHEVGKHHLDGAVLATSSGPSCSFIPRYGYQATDAFLFGAGAAFFAGPRGDDGSIATAQKGLDQVFVYADWRP